jgi:acyl-ACP thioesterase
MKPIHERTYILEATDVNSADRLKNSRLLAIMQEIAGEHSALLGADRSALEERKLFWAVIRHRVQITRLPQSGESIRVCTWPMPTTRTAYPRATVAYDADGNELFRGISLWILMDMTTRAMVLPGKSGVEVAGSLQGNELTLPGSLLPQKLPNREDRTVRFSDLDLNGHMNNCRYLEWVDDLLPAEFHRTHSPKQLLVCYLSEAREAEKMEVCWEVSEQSVLRVDAQRSGEVSAGHSRVFAAQVQF